MAHLPNPAQFVQWFRESAPYVHPFGARRVPNKRKAAANGVDIYTAAKIAGTSVRTIEQHYAKPLRNEARER